MAVPGLKGLSLSFALAVLGLSPAHATIVDIGFSGTVSSASDDPSTPAGDVFKVGQKFSGDFAYDTSISGDYEGDFIQFQLQKFDVIIGGQDFSSRFIPRGIYRSDSGDTEFLSGGADQGGSTSIDLNLPSFFLNYPTARELIGRRANFDFSDFYQGGGEVSGTARLTAVGGASAVPEPTTWAMMIGGVGMTGGMMRRKRRATTGTPALA